MAGHHSVTYYLRTIKPIFISFLSHLTCDVLGIKLNRILISRGTVKAGGGGDLQVGGA
jgi:hypothetical protein